MINKKLKSYLEYKIVHPRPQTDYNSTILKLKAYQKSIEKGKDSKDKSRQRSQSHGKNESNSFAQTTLSSLPRSKRSAEKTRKISNLSTELSRHKQRKAITTDDNEEQFTSINSKIRQLQDKVSILMGDGGSNNRDFLSRKITNTSSKSKQKRNASQEKSFDSNNNNSAVERSNRGQLRNSFINTFCSMEQRNRENDVSSFYRFLIIMRMEASKLLTNLNIESQQTNFFENIESPEQLFFALQNILSVSIANRISQSQQQISCMREDEIKRLKIELQGYKIQAQFSENRSKQLQNQRNQIQSRNYKLSTRIQALETEVFQLKCLNTECQNSLLANQLEQQKQHRQNMTKKLHYEQIVQSNLNRIENQQTLHMKLKQLLQNQSEENEQLKISKNAIMDKLQKWQRDYMKLHVRYQIGKNEKKDIEEDRLQEIDAYEQTKAVIRNGYIELVEQLSKQLNEVREQSVTDRLALKQQKSKNSQMQQLLKSYESDYLTLNEDYSRDVREWVTRQQHYERTIKQLRHQIQDLNVSVAQYSSMLASYASGKKQRSDQLGDTGEFDS